MYPRRGLHPCEGAALRAVEERTHELRDAIVSADDNGVPIGRIAESARLTRSSVYNHLRAAGKL